MKDFRNLPLPTLRTFEAAARHQSLSKAAAELHLTDSAVSHQLRKLESALGYDLFNKAGRGVVLTEAGQVFAKTVATALQNILASALLLSEVGQEGGRLDIACPPMFAGGWLAKHLKGFCRDHPSVECHIRLAENQKIHEIADIDVGILFGSGGWPHKWSTLLAHVNITPVCSPRLFNQIGKTITKVSDLHDVILLHWDDGSEWRRWLTEAGAQDPHSFTRGLYCSDLGMAIDLAINGTGVALVSDTLSSSDLATGNLLTPFPFSIDAFGGWHVVCSQASLQRSSTRVFMRWLLGHFGGSAALDTALAGPGMMNP
ncbi:LysR substrate-binding domain-containing protein [Phyllobacterium endophyticum]|uniref:LysR substrate-binding domain-containing protein n=1 Tax=Phyllobacterium endophyticum TaxID=1149773 RepID=UPI0011E82106|nr:LysR substrate-binding domain-containing protein [Phyllobacterium endophyticum]